MKLRTLATITTILTGASALSAQPCDPPGFSFVLNRDTTCVGQPVTAIPTGSTGGTITWNFCDGAVRNGTFERTTVASFSSGGPTSTLLVEDQGQYYGFFTESGTLKRIHYGDSPLNTPSAPQNVIGLPGSVNSRGLCAYVQNGTRYLFANQANAPTSPIFRFDFGNAFSNAATVQTINVGNVITNPGQMQLVRDVNGAVKILIGCIQSSRVALVNFGDDVTNNSPASTFISIPGNGNNMSVDVIRTCTGWQMLAGGGNKLSLYNLGNIIDPNNTPPTLVGEVTSAAVGNLLPEIRGIKLFSDAGKWYALVENGNASGGFANHSIVLGLGEAGTALSLPVTYASNYAGPGFFVGALSGLKYNGQNVFMSCLWYVGGTGGLVERLRFIPSCDLPPFTGPEPPAVVYDRLGCLNVGLYTQADDGTNHIFGQSLCVSGADVNFSNSPACLGFATEFFNQSQIFAPESTLWQWDFGDQTFSQESSPFHTYSNIGQYTVTLSAYSPAGCVNEISRTIEVISPPTASFSVQAFGGCMTDPHAFNDLSVGNPPVVAWFWDMGDGTTYHTPDVEHRYVRGGAYNVRLIVENEGGCRDTMQQIVDVPGFDFDVTNACIGNETVFSVAFFYPPNVAVIGYTWEIFTEPPVVYNIENPTHVFQEGGNYDVKLTLRTNSGCTDTIRKTIFVAPPPVAGFSTQNNPISGMPVYFINESNAFGAEVVRWRWDFGAPGNADTASTFNAEYTYALAGTYAVVLTMETAAGCRDTVVQNIVVCDRDFCNLPSFSTPDTLCIQKEIYFKAPISSCYQKSRGIIVVPFLKMNWNRHLFTIPSWDSMCHEE